VEKIFTIRAELGEANVVAMGRSIDIDRMLDRWEACLREQSDPDHRNATKDFVIQALRQGDHHRDRKIAEGVVLALTWLTAKGDLGATVLPYMRAGGVALEFEITHQGGNTYNFRTKVPGDVSRSMSL
jgi:hypothetical protein